MELKPPTPLGERQPNIQSNIPTETVSNSEKKKDPFRIQLPKIKLPHINLPNINISTEKRKKLIYLSVIGIPILLLAILFLFISSHVRAEPYRVARLFLERIEYKDISGAYEMTTKAYRIVVPEKEFKQFITTLNTVDISNPKEVSKKIEDVPGMGKYAYITYQISGYYVDIIVYNDQVDWGIHSIDIKTSR